MARLADGKGIDTKEIIKIFREALKKGFDRPFESDDLWVDGRPQRDTYTRSHFTFATYGELEAHIIKEAPILEGWDCSSTELTQAINTLCKNQDCFNKDTWQGFHLSLLPNGRNSFLIRAWVQTLPNGECSAHLEQNKKRRETAEKKEMG